MKSIELEGIVLKRNKINPLDSYLKLFTREIGITDVFCQGSNHPKNRLNVACQPFVYGTFQMIGKNEFKLIDADIFNNFYSIREHMETLIQLSYISKLLLGILPDRVSQKLIYESYVNSVFVLNKYPIKYQQVILYLYGAILYDMGIYPIVEEHAKYIDIINGSLTCEVQSEHSLNVSEGVSTVFQLLKSATFIQFLNTKIPEELMKNTSVWLEKYIEYHLDIDISQMKANLNDYLGGENGKQSTI